MKLLWLAWQLLLAWLAPRPPRRRDPVSDVGDEWAARVDSTLPELEERLDTVLGIRLPPFIDWTEV